MNRKGIEYLTITPRLEEAKELDRGESCFTCSEEAFKRCWPPAMIADFELHPFDLMRIVCDLWECGIPETQETPKV